MSTFYLSGPMRGKPDFNYPMFHAAEYALTSLVQKECGPWRIINPACNFSGERGLPFAQYMQADIAHVLESDVIVLLPGWESSTGAQLEARVAEACGKQFWLASTDRGEWTFTPSGTLPLLPPRAAILDEAKSLITGDRNNSYGPPMQDFTRSAEALQAYGYRGPEGRALAAHDVAVMVIAVKLSRLMWTPGKRDSWADIAGYAGCGYECAREESMEVMECAA